MLKFGSNTIGKIYLGSNLIGKAYFGSNPVYEAGGVVPTVGTSYIRNSAGAYIDTGITADNTVKVIVWARNYNPGATYMFGSRVSQTSGAFGLNSGGGTVTGCFSINYGTKYSDIKTHHFELLSTYHKYELYDGVLKIDDVQIGSVTSTTFSNDKNIYLYGLNNNGTAVVCNFPIDIHACQIYKNGTLVRDFIATDSPSVGLKDRVSGNMFTNAGTGSLTYGTFDMSDYTHLQYVSCTTGQYIDTGAKASYAEGLTVKFRPVSTTKSNRFLLGVRTTSSSGRCEIRIGDSNTINKQFVWALDNADGYLYNSSSKNDVDLLFVKGKNSGTGTLYEGVGTALGNQTKGSSGFVTTYNLAIGAINLAGTMATGNFYEGRLYYVGLGSTRSFVPMLYNNVAGLYDTYGDTFYPSTSGTDFVAGPTV